jgi:hypothetical protein
MNVLRPLLLIIGIVMVLMGLLWIGQGTGLVMWPSESFMLAERQWAWNGAILAAAGAVLLWFARRR